jgi:hypothetical protein
MPDQNYKISSDLEIVPERPRKGYPICIEDWNYIKEKIGSIKCNLNFYSNIGSTFIGTAIGGLIAFLSGGITSGINQTNCIAAIIVAFVLGSAAYFIGWKQQGLQEERAKDIKNYMEKIDQKFIATT